MDEILRIPGNEDGLHAVAQGREFRCQIAAIPIRQHHVGEEQVHVTSVLTKYLYRLFSIPGFKHSVSCTRQDLASHFAHEGFIFHKQNGSS